MLGLSFHSPGLKDNFCNHPVSNSKSSDKIDKEVKRRHNIITNMTFSNEFGRKGNAVPIAKHNFASIAYWDV